MGSEMCIRDSNTIYPRVLGNQVVGGIFFSDLETFANAGDSSILGYELNYFLYQLYDDRSYLKSSYEKIMDLKSKLDKKTGEKFINYPLESEIIETYQSIS